MQKGHKQHFTHTEDLLVFLVRVFEITESCCSLC